MIKILLKWEADASLGGMRSCASGQLASDGGDAAGTPSDMVFHLAFDGFPFFVLLFLQFNHFLNGFAHEL